MVIRQQQFQVFEEDAEERFVDRVIGFVSETEPDSIKGMDQPVLRDRTRAGIARARERGFQEDSSIGLFASLTLTIGPDFDSEPECSRVLDDPTLPPDARVQELLAPGRNIPWDEISGRYRRNSG